MIDRAGPYGAGNPEPVVAVPDARIVDCRVVGENQFPSSPCAVLPD